MGTSGTIRTCMPTLYELVPTLACDLPILLPYSHTLHSRQQSSNVHALCYALLYRQGRGCCLHISCPPTTPPCLVECVISPLPLALPCPALHGHTQEAEDRGIVKRLFTTTSLTLPCISLIFQTFQTPPHYFFQGEGGIRGMSQEP
jgi:hypothetical protein